MPMIGQKVLIRTDLQFPTGLLVAQAAHIHALPMIAVLQNKEIDNKEDFLAWLPEPYIYIHGVPNKEVLEHFIDKCTQHDVPVRAWYDTVMLDIGSNPEPFNDVLIGASLGPCDSDKIKMVIGTLPLLK